MGKFKGFKSLAPHIQKSLKKSVSAESPFVFTPFDWAINKVLKNKNVIRKGYVKNFSEPLMKADVSLGMAAQRAQKKVYKKGNLFTENKLLSTGSKKKSLTGKVEHRIPTLSAPVSKASKMVMPLLGAWKLDELTKGKKNMSQKNITEADLKKTASMINQLHSRNKELEKKAHATKLLYKQAELGQILFPKTHCEFEEKVAELMHKNLNVVEEAIKMAAASEEVSNTFGGLASQSNPAKSGNAQAAFQRSILEE